MPLRSRVLVVDDEPAIRALVAKIVQRAGLDVETAADGVEAIEKMQGATYSVLVVDLQMPRLDGHGVVEFVNGLTGVKPAVIIISAADTALLRRLNPRVVHSIVRKPFEIDVLGELIVAAAQMIDSQLENEEKPAGSIVEFRHNKTS